MNCKLLKFDKRFVMKRYKSMLLREKNKSKSKLKKFNVKNLNLMLPYVYLLKQRVIDFR